MRDFNEPPKNVPAPYIGPIDNPDAFPGIPNETTLIPGRIVPETPPEIDHYEPVLPGRRMGEFASSHTFSLPEKADTSTAPSTRQPATRDAMPEIIKADTRLPAETTTHPPTSDTTTHHTAPKKEVTMHHSSEKVIDIKPATTPENTTSILPAEKIAAPAVKVVVDQPARLTQEKTYTKNNSGTDVVVTKRTETTDSPQAPESPEATDKPWQEVPKVKVEHPTHLDGALVKMFMNEAPEQLILSKNDRAIMDSAKKLLVESIKPNAEELATTLPPGMPDTMTVTKSLWQKPSIANQVAAAAILEERGPRDESETFLGKTIDRIKDRVTPDVVSEEHLKKDSDVNSMATLHTVANKIMQQEYPKLYFNSGTAKATILLSMAVERAAAFLPTPEQLVAQPEEELPENIEFTIALLETFERTYATNKENDLKLMPESVKALHMRIDIAARTAARASQRVNPEQQQAAYSQKLAKLVAKTVGEHGAEGRERHKITRIQVPTPGELLEEKWATELQASKAYNSSRHMSVSPATLVRHVANAFEVVDDEEAKGAIGRRKAVDSILTSVGVLLERRSFDTASDKAFKAVWNEWSSRIIELCHEKYLDKENDIRRTYSGKLKKEDTIVDFSPPDARLVNELNPKAYPKELVEKIEFLQEHLFCSAYDNFKMRAYRPQETVGGVKILPTHPDINTREVMMAAYTYGLAQKGTLSSENVDPRLSQARDKWFLNRVGTSHVEERGLPLNLLAAIDNIRAAYPSHPY